MSRLIAEIQRWSSDPEELPRSHEDILKSFPVLLVRARIRPRPARRPCGSGACTTRTGRGGGGAAAGRLLRASYVRERCSRSRGPWP
jgi:hypothetical protein